MQVAPTSRRNMNTGQTFYFKSEWDPTQWFAAEARVGVFPVQQAFFFAQIALSAKLAANGTEAPVSLHSFRPKGTLDVDNNEADLNNQAADGFYQLSQNTYQSV